MEKNPCANITVELDIENRINNACEKLDLATNEQERKILEAELFSLVEQLNGNTIYLTVQ